MERADIFAADTDLSDFTPRKRSGPPAEEVRKVAENTAFKSREPQAAPQTRAQGRGRRERRIYRTGRDAHFSCKADPAVVDEFYAIADANDWVMGETLERAVSALKRELGGGGQT